MWRSVGIRRFAHGTPFEQVSAAAEVPSCARENSYTTWSADAVHPHCPAPHVGLVPQFTPSSAVKVAVNQFVPVHEPPSCTTNPVTLPPAMVTFTLGNAPAAQLAPPNATVKQLLVASQSTLLIWHVAPGPVPVGVAIAVMLFPVLPVNRITSLISLPAAPWICTKPPTVGNAPVVTAGLRVAGKAERVSQMVVAVVTPALASEVHCASAIEVVAPVAMSTVSRRGP
mmetsp:Transcript_48245/g.114796  ORF Transcript_48245/g.114796 Transcript_48245/m.114796 type:complete len:227 (+) Transcript_48245:1971-2651(+)